MVDQLLRGRVSTARLAALGWMLVLVAWISVTDWLVAEGILSPTMNCLGDAIVAVSIGALFVMLARYMDEVIELHLKMKRLELVDASARSAFRTIRTVMREVQGPANRVDRDLAELRRQIIESAPGLEPALVAVSKGVDEMSEAIRRVDREIVTRDFPP